MSQDEHISYAPTQEYSSTAKWPSGAAISGIGNHAYYNTNPFDDREVAIIGKNAFSRSTHQFADDDFICHNFFSLARLNSYPRRFKYPEWVYESRRQAQEILPFLTLGPFSVLRDLDYLRSEGFTLLLAVRNQRSAQARLVSGEKAAAELGILAESIDVIDYQHLASEFPRAIRRINDHLAGVDGSALFAADPNVNFQSSACPNKKIFVFCESGNERSAAVVIAYIMVMLNMDPARAVCTVHHCRSSVTVQDSMQRHLAAFHSILTAKRDVECAKRAISSAGTASLATSPALFGNSPVKRSFQDSMNDEDDESDEEMAVDGKENMRAGRRGIAPFQDCTP